MASGWDRALRAHLTRYPLAEPVDVSKYVVQALVGPRHAGVRARAVLEGMRAELDAFASDATSPAEPLVIEPLGPDGTFARVHLRTWVRERGDDLAPIVRAFRATLLARAIHGIAASAESDAITAALAHQRPHWPALDLDAELRAATAHHHSAAFRDAYRPCYRVVRVSLL